MAEADNHVRIACGCAGERADKIEWHALTQVVLVTGNRRQAAASFTTDKQKAPSVIGRGL